MKAEILIDVVLKLWLGLNNTAIWKMNANLVQANNAFSFI